MAQLSRLAALRLLTVSRTHVTDAGLMNLVHCNGLRHLLALETGVTADGASEFETVLPHADVVGVKRPMRSSGSPGLVVEEGATRTVSR